jgi:hypothetical protein
LDFWNLQKKTVFLIPIIIYFLGGKFCNLEGVTVNIWIGLSHFRKRRVRIKKKKILDKKVLYFGAALRTNWNGTQSAHKGKQRGEGRWRYYSHVYGWCGLGMGTPPPLCFVSIAASTWGNGAWSVFTPPLAVKVRQSLAECGQWTLPEIA